LSRNDGWKLSFLIYISDVLFPSIIVFKYDSCSEIFRGKYLNYSYFSGMIKQVNIELNEKNKGKKSYSGYNIKEVTQ